MKDYKSRLIKSINENKIDKELLYEIIKDLISEYNVGNFVDYIIIKDSNIDNGKYLQYKKMLIIDLFVDKRKSIIENYANIFTIIFHELRHAYQIKKIVDNHLYFHSQYIDYIFQGKDADLIKSLTYYISSESTDLTMLYFFKHDNYPMEHEANITSLIDSKNYLLSVLPEYYNNKEYLIKNNEMLFNNLLRGYKTIFRNIISPIERINNEQIKKEYYDFIVNNQILTLYDKLVLGLPVEKDIYEQIYNETIKKKNKPEYFEYIKKLK